MQRQGWLRLPCFEFEPRSWWDYDGGGGIAASFDYNVNAMDGADGESTGTRAP